MTQSVTQIDDETERKKLTQNDLILIPFGHRYLRQSIV